MPLRLPLVIFYLFSSLAVVFFFVLPSTAKADCNELNQQAYKLYKVKNAQKLEVLVSRYKNECKGDYVQNLTARVLYDSSQDIQENKRLEILQKVVSLAPIYTGLAWRARDEQGDLLHKKNHFQLAFKSYEEALNIVGYDYDTSNKANAKVNYEEAPSAEKILAIHKKAQRERLLYTAFIPSSKTADNKAGGVQILGYKGVCVTELAMPIQFDTNSFELAKDATLYAEQLFTMLKKYQHPNITITGHADERGGDIINDPLSKARAASVKKYLTSKGYSNDKLSTIGKGSRVHFDDPEYDNMEEVVRYKLDRRVEVSFPKTICDEN